jgi:hypothetical protein
VILNAPQSLAFLVAVAGAKRAADAVGPVALAAIGARIDVLGATSRDITALATTGVGVCAIRDPLTGFARVPLATLAAEGVPFAFGSGGGSILSGWEAVAAAVNHPDPEQRISARAAFAASTKGGWRATGFPDCGVLVPGAPAHYAVWHADDLIVQAPDDRIQAWSTDPRSGTPGLPDMSPEAPMPRCLRTAVGGRRVW